MDVFNVNVASTARLLDWSRRAGVSQFILASSGGVGGAQRSHSYYLASKRSAEALPAGYAALFQRARYAVLFRLRQRPEARDAGAAADRCGALWRPDSACRRRQPAFFNPVHVDDAVNAVVRAIELNAAGTVDVAGPEVLTVRAMADTVARLMGRDAEFDCDASATPEDVIGDISAMSRELTAPRRSFAEGVAELVPSSLRA